MRNAVLSAWLTLGAGLALCVAGCGRKPTTEPDATPAPPTEEEAQAFGKQLEAAVTSGDREGAYRLFRMDDLLERSLSGLKVSESRRAKALASARKGESTAVVNEVLAEVRRGGNYRFLRVRTVGGRPHVLMRFISTENVGSYQEFLLARFPDGQVASEDFHVLHTGERVSQTLRRAFLEQTAAEEGGRSGKSEGKEKLFNDLLNQGLNKEGLAVFRLLPPEAQRDKVTLIRAATAASQVDEPEYLRLLGVFRKHYPDDPAIDFLSIDYFVVNKQFDQALACIDRVDNALGGDPFLQVRRAVVFFEAGRRTEARAAIKKAIEQEPTLQAAYWQRVTFALKEKNHADTLTWLKRVVERCGVALDRESMRGNADYADFVGSPEFVELWLWYGERKK
jgi:hypothetical protein